MSLFFYRAWAGIDDPNSFTSIQSQLTELSPLYYTRWGYSALLGVTLLTGLLVNSVYLIGYLACPWAMLEVPHIVLVSLSIRDLLVCVTVLPAALDWLMAGLTSWPGGSTWCSAAVFFDYWFSTVHPLLVLLLCLILYTRKVPQRPITPHTVTNPSIRTSVHHINSRMSTQSGHSSHRPTDIRVPSTAESVQSHQSGRHQGFRRGFAKGPGSVNGSQRGPPSVSGSVSQSRHLSPPVGHHMRSSSPLHQVPEDHGYPASDVEHELWELASMEYPGKDDLDLDYGDEDEGDPDEPRLREWLKYLVPLCWLAALGISIPAAMLAISDNKPPGCYLAAKPENIARSRYSYLQQDPSLNLLISSLVLSYIVPATLMVMLSILLCTTRWTKDGKLNRFYKLSIGLCVMFIAARSPVDIIQFKDVIHAAQGFSIVNRRPDELEHEILLVWAALLPVVANPVIYLFCVTEYRLNISRAWQNCFGKKLEEDDQSDFVDLQDKQLGSSTMETDVL